ncbi:uncharacterized protein [Aquarana catesbeiana]|uniref:uncharacterized protein isoform X2 n=1 Tax=Aquarana catesbeiana TaxID=8400 RepID=UPI003CCA096F
MPRCIVQGCPHYSGRKNSTPGVTFHMFPKNLATIKKWLQQINQNFGDVDAFAQGVLEGKAGVIRICSAHFAIECYRFVGSQKILLEDAVPTIFLGKPAVKVESSFCPMIFPDKQKPAIRMESAVHPESFPEKEKMPNKVESAVGPIMFANKEKTAVKVEAIKTSKGIPTVGNVPDMKEPAVSVKSTVPTLYWNMQPLQMPILPLLPVNMANPHWASNDLAVSKSNPWSANDLANGGANVEEKHDVDTSVPRVQVTKAESHVENVMSTDNFPNMQDVESHAKLPNAMFGEKDVHVSRCPDSSLSPAIQKEDKSVQWPEYETSGPAWKVLHDHYYKVRRAIDRSALRNGIESCYQEMDSEGELLAILQYVTSVLWRNRRKKELKMERILNQTLEIITLITGEEWVIVKKDSIHKGIHELTGEHFQDKSEPFSVPAPTNQNHSDLSRKSCRKKREKHGDFKSPDRYTGFVGPDSSLPVKVPVKCGNVAVFFTLDEWSYLERHRQEYAETVADNGPVKRTWQVREHWDSEEEYFSEEEEEEEEVEDSPKRKSSPEWKPGCDSLDSAEEEEEENQNLNRPITTENGVQGESEPETSSLTIMEEEAQYDCDACGERLTSKEDLIRHKAINHAVKRYPCPICGIQYDYKSQFIIHQRAHTGEKPFVCQECGAKFGHKSSYLVHERRHKEGKTFECDKCDRRFDKKCELVKHEKTHLQKKRHKCHKCGKRYSNRSTLMRHKWAHKGE